MTKTHSLPIRASDRHIFLAIKNGSKSVETRAGGRYNIKEGDFIEFSCGKEKLRKKVKNLMAFKSIEETVKAIDFKKIMPFAESIEEVKKVYYSFPNYKERIEKFGLITFELEQSW